MFVILAIYLFSFSLLSVKPVPKPVSTYYQIRPDSDYEVKLNFSANPTPIKKEWRYGDSFQNIAVSIPIPGANDRYTTDIEVRAQLCSARALTQIGLKQQQILETLISKIQKRINI